MMGRPLYIQRTDHMSKLFGTNGVRGVVNQDMNSQLALQMGKAIGTVLPGTVAIATDTRYTCDMIRSAVSSGLMAVGCDVLYLGSIPTPALQYYVKTHQVSAGVMITASHNPPEFNGIKVIDSDGTEASAEHEKEIEDRYDEVIPLVEWEKTGSCREISGAADDYVDAIISKLDVEAIRAANLTVVLDCTNLSFLSSAGIRIVLRLAKQVPSLKLINVPAEVYDVLDMTGLTEMIEVSLMVMHHWLTTLGIQMRMACGMTMRQVVWLLERPKLRAASVWPGSTAWMPPRKISDI